VRGFRLLRRHRAPVVRWVTSLACVATVAGALAGTVAGTVAGAQASDSGVVRVDLPIGRSYVIHPAVAITRVSVANPDVADVVVMGARDVVVNGHAGGETDVIVWEGETTRQHYRMLVHAPADQQQVVLWVQFAEVRRNVLRDYGLSALYSSGSFRAGTGSLSTPNPSLGGDPSVSPIDPLTIPLTSDFGTILTNFGTKHLLALLQAEEQKGDARILAEPRLIAGNKDSASFLAGGELPIPIAQNTATGVPTVTIVYREFGIRLNFTPDIVSDSLIRLKIKPEFSQLDFPNGIKISGFTIPALRTRRIESTVDVRRDQSLVISGLVDDELQKTKTGIPLLMNLPILGALFSSTNWQRNETELLVVVTPSIIDPARPRAQDVLQLVPDSTLPAREAIQPRLPLTPPPTAPPPPTSH
jgi:pilus assembly protein CpaC